MNRTTDFIGRNIELKLLNDAFKQNRSLACAVYGRHMIGKTALLKKFCEGKRSVHLSCSGGTLSRIFESFSSVLEEYIIDCPEIDTVDDLTDCLAKLKSRNKTVVILDDFQELTALEPETTEIIGRFIDKRIHDLNMMLIICSASIRQMTTYIDDRDEPLCGRFSSTLKVRPLPYRDARLFHPDMSEEDRIRTYCIAGGIPSYHLIFSENTAKDNIVRHILGPISFFRSMAANSISELTPIQSSGRIMSVLSDGAASLKELSDETGFTGAAIMKTMDMLMMNDIVRKERPLGGKKDPIYRMTDGPLLFYHRIIQPNCHTAEDDDTELTYLMLEEEMEMSYRPIFEEICKQHILRNYYCIEFGRWWNKRSVDGETIQEDVDIIAKVLVNNEESTLLCECGFFDRPTDMNDLYNLKDKRERIRDIGNVRYMMFSRSGFTDELKGYAEAYPSERIELISIDALIQ